MLTLVAAGADGAVPHSIRTQTGDDAGREKCAARRARRWTPWCKALGGQAWLEHEEPGAQGHIAAFFQGNPDPGTTEYYEFHQWPDHDRIE